MKLANVSVLVLSMCGASFGGGACTSCASPTRTDSAVDGGDTPSVDAGVETSDVAMSDDMIGQGCPGDDDVWQRFPFACSIDVHIAVDVARAVRPLRWQSCDWPPGGCLELVSDWNLLGLQHPVSVESSHGNSRFLAVGEAGSVATRGTLVITPLDGQPVAAFEAHTGAPGLAHASMIPTLGTSAIAMDLGRAVDPNTVQYWWVAGPYSNDAIWRRAIATETTTADYASPLPLDGSLEIVRPGNGLQISDRATGTFRILTTNADINRVNGTTGMQYWSASPLGNAVFFAFGDAYNPASIWRISIGGGAPVRLYTTAVGADIGWFGTDGLSNLVWVEGHDRDATSMQFASAAAYTASVTDSTTTITPRRVGGLTAPWLIEDALVGGGHFVYDPRDRTRRIMNLADGTYWTIEAPAGKYIAWASFVTDTEFGYLIGDLSGGTDVFHRIRLDALAPPAPAL